MYYRYSRWDGSQETSFDADDVIDELSDELLAEGDPQAALRRLLRQGWRGRFGQRSPGLNDLMKRVRERRQQELDRYDLGSLMDDIRERLDRVVETERAGVEQRLDEARRHSSPDQDETAANLGQMLEKIAERKLRFLESLPKDLAGAVRALSDYEFMDADARQQFQELLAMLREQMLKQYFEGMQQALREMSPEQLRRTREMVRDLNSMLREKLEGREPDFQSFKERYGDMFPPEIDSLADLVEYMQRRNAQMQSLLDSMSSEQRQSLRDLMDSLLRDDRLRWDLAQLAANLNRVLPLDELSRRYPFRGDESLTLDGAMRLMEELRSLDELEQQLRSAGQGRANLDEIDQSKVRRLLGDEAADSLDRLAEAMKMLEEAGYVERQGDRWELTPRAMRRIGQKALRDIFAQLRRDRAGKHQTEHRGAGGERADEEKRYEFGDPFLLDIEKTLRNALARSGPGTPVEIKPDDFTVYRTELLARCSTVLMLDMSRSMVLRDFFLPAKKVAMALDSLIRGQFPNDHLYVVGFSEYARELKPEDLPRISLRDHEMGTNLHHGLMLARRMLDRHKGGTRQIIVITDGEPTAHLLENGRAYFDYPPDQQTIVETLKEVTRCTRQGIVINTFMLEQSSYLTRFVSEMTKINKGRAFFCTPERLGEYILVDYVSNKTKRIH